MKKKSRKSSNHFSFLNSILVSPLIFLFFQTRILFFSRSEMEKMMRTLGLGLGAISKSTTSILSYYTYITMRLEMWSTQFKTHFSTKAVTNRRWLVFLSSDVLLLIHCATHKKILFFYTLCSRIQCNWLEKETVQWNSICNRTISKWNLILECITYHVKKIDMRVCTIVKKRWIYGDPAFHLWCVNEDDDDNDDQKV